MSEATGTMTVLKPEHFARIRNLHLWARLIVEGMNVGVHRSPYHGFSAEFLEYRPYQRGESTRLIDWRKYAKSDTTVVRLFQDETNLYGYLLLDTSASMRFASAGHVDKHSFARVLCASLAWILIRQHDAVGFAAFDDRARILLRPRSTNVQLRSIIGQIDALEARGSTGSGAAINELAGHVRRRGLTVIVSDLLDDPASIERGLRHLRYKRQDVIVLWVRDPMEQQFEHGGLVRMRDMETNGELELDAAVAARYFNEGMEAHSRRLRELCRSLEVDLVEAGTQEPVEKVLTHVVRKRRRMN